MPIDQIFAKVILGNPLQSYAIAGGSILVGLIGIRLVQGIVLQRLKHRAAQNRIELDDVLIRILERSALPVLYFGVFYAALQSLQLNTTLATSLNAIGATILTISGVRCIGALAEYGLRVYWLSNRWASEEERTEIQLKLNLVMPAVRVVLWSLGLIFLLQNLGFNLSAVLASLGIGGVAVALASQGVLQDLFSYFAIAIDAPFRLGDTILVDGMVGTVDRIGIKTTRLVSITGEELVFSNSFLTSARIQNYRKMAQRRIVFRIGVTYDTPPAALRDIPPLIEGIIQGLDYATFDRCHFASCGASSLDIETVYYVDGNDYATYLDIQQQINLALLEEFAVRGIEFAYPTQTLFIQPNAAQVSAPQPNPEAREAGDSGPGPGPGAQSGPAQGAEAWGG